MKRTSGRFGDPANGAFYYSWRSGSGIDYSILGKLAPEGDAMVSTSSIEYTNPNLGPPNLVVALESGQVVVNRATVYWGKFNDWPSPLLGHAHRRAAIRGQTHLHHHVVRLAPRRGQ
jgi:hypothetical protein